MSRDHRAHADALWEAERGRVAIPPLSETDEGLTADDAYAIQKLNADRRLAAGARVLGRKVGLTSKPMQDQLGVREPDYGVLLDDMFVEEGEAIDTDALIAPRIEAEIAFVLARDLQGPGVTALAAAQAVAGALPALEIIDSRIADWRIALVDTVADNASCGRVVLGSRVTPLGTLDLRLVGMALRRNGEVVETGAGAAVLGDPLRCVAWLANAIAGYGDGLRAGDVVMAGALHRSVPVAPGDVFHAAFADLGDVTTRFARKEPA